MLYIVSTPIGNMEDITLRAIRTLKQADFVIAEDTRHTGILLKKYEIETPLLSFHSHSPESQLQKLLNLLKEEKTLALVSDAGTPGISDPGYVLIKTAIENKIPVSAIPGPSALITAAAAAGLPVHKFLYLGFLPLKKGRKMLLESLKDSPYTIIFYEAPHRIQRTLKELMKTFGERKIAVCREMTKMFEEVFRGNLSEACAHFEKTRPRGEFTIVLGPPQRTQKLLEYKG